MHTESPVKHRLTPREVECLGLIADGLNNIEIARQLRLSESTIAMHLLHARQKLHASTREHAVALAMRLSIIT